MAGGSGCPIPCNRSSTMERMPSKTPTGHGFRSPGACAADIRVGMQQRSCKRSFISGTAPTSSKGYSRWTGKLFSRSPMGPSFETRCCKSMVTTLMALIMGPLALVLLLACTNVTMLFLSRSIKRRGEIAVRLALGAGRARLMRMLAIESFLTAAAGIVSIYLAARFPSLLFGIIDPAGADATSFMPDWRVFGYLAALVLIATVVSALAPMRESFRFDLVTALKGREGAATARSHTTSALIVVQLAMSFVLLAAAVLFARLPSLIANADPGFETRQTMMVPLDIDIPPYTTTSALAFYRSLESRILEVPGVQSLAYESVAPFKVAPVSEVRLDKQTKGQGRPASVDNVSPDFFSTFGIALMHGRSFQHSDVPADRQRSGSRRLPGIRESVLGRQRSCWQGRGHTRRPASGRDRSSKGHPLGTFQHPRRAEALYAARRAIARRPALRALHRQRRTRFHIDRGDRQEPGRDPG